MPKIIESIRLTFTEGTSDKEYNASILEVTGGYVVNCAWGRRGSPSQTGTKTPSPVSLSSAQAIYGKVVGEKKAKGYTSSGTGVPFTGSPASVRVTPYVPQLLNEVDEAEMERLILDPDFCAQEKSDGERRGALKGGAVSANRKGLSVGVPTEVAEAIADGLNHEDGDLDGELVKGEYVVWGIFRYKELDLTNRPYRSILSVLGEVFSGNDIAYVTYTAFTTEEKRALLANLRAKNAEGIVFKRLSAPHAPGKPASGGDWFKFKFKASATVRVSDISTGKRSVGMEVLETSGAWREVGKVTIPPSSAIPAVGTLIEVEYLYAFPKGSLFQPVYKGERPDLDEPDAKASQLKFKAGS